MNAQAKHRGTRRIRAGQWIACLGLVIAGSAQADAVTDWNATFDAVSPTVGGPPQRAYLGAMVHIAIHDALNSIDRRYETYNVVPTASGWASPDAAIAAAARDVLINQLNRPPESPAKAAARASVEASYLAALVAIPNGSAENNGVAAGQAAAAAIIAQRLNDGSDTPNLPYTLAPGPGVHQPTAPNFPAPANAGFALIKPFAMRSTSQFRAEPGELFDLKGIAYTLNYNLVKSIGEFNTRASRPDSRETDIARFWPSGGANWSLVARTIVAGRHLDRWQHARLFALLLIAETDGAIEVFDTKYTYNFWRPVTAIRWANDGNPFTRSDSAWLPFFSFIGPWSTPPYPDYSCGLSTASGANTEVLRRFFGTDHVPYKLKVTAPALALAPPPAEPLLPAKEIERSYSSLSQAAEESARSRVYAGIHFYEGCMVGVRYGEKVGRFAYQHYLRPLRPR
jgi:hypothetical protein